MNGLSVLPGAMYCFYYCLSGTWLWDNVDQVDPAALGNIGDEATCRMSSWLLQDLYVMPPLPILFIALGIIAHAPFSFIYHWHYCTKLPPGKPRFDHWSRKFDQAFIHVISTFMSYGTSGRWDFFVANAIFNAHCVWSNLVSTTVSFFTRNCLDVESVFFCFSCSILPSFFSLPLNSYLLLNRQPR